MSYQPGFETAVSPSRFAPFRAASASDDHAWALYAWNIELLAAWTTVLHLLEVTFRNTVHDALTADHARPDWWAAPGLRLDLRTTDNIDRSIRRTGGSPGLVVADLTFGVWVDLIGTGGRYDYEANLWRPAIRHRFNGPGLTRNVVHSRFDQLRQLRNRWGHHESMLNGCPITTGRRTPIRVPISDLHDQAIEAIAWINQDMAIETRRLSTVPTILAHRP